MNPPEFERLRALLLDADDTEVSRLLRLFDAQLSTGASIQVGGACESASPHDSGVISAGMLYDAPVSSVGSQKQIMHAL